MNRKRIQVRIRGDQKLPADLIKGGRVKEDLHQLKTFIIPGLTCVIDFGLGGESFNICFWGILGPYEPNDL